MFLWTQKQFSASNCLASLSESTRLSHFYWPSEVPCKRNCLSDCEDRVRLNFGKLYSLFDDRKLRWYFQETCVDGNKLWVWVTWDWKHRQRTIALCMILWRNAGYFLRRNSTLHSSDKARCEKIVSGMEVSSQKFIFLRTLHNIKIKVDLHFQVKYNMDSAIDW